MITWNGQQVLDEIDKRIDAQGMALGARVVAEAVRFAPKKTGRLALSLTFHYDAAAKSLVFTSDDPLVDYDIFQEYGTRNMMAHPHWRPALEAVGAIYGFETQMTFAVPHIRDPLLASGPTFHAPKNLTAKQREHVKNALKPISKRLWEGRAGNVSRTKMHVRQEHKF